MEDEAAAGRDRAARTRTPAGRLFVGRDTQVDAFVDDLAAADPSVGVWAVTGQPGVGRSALLRRLRSEARRLGSAVAMDATAGGPLAAIGRLAAGLGRFVDTHEIDAAIDAFAFEDHRHGPVPLAPGDDRAGARRRALGELSPLAVDALNRSAERGWPTVLCADGVGEDPRFDGWLADLTAGAYGRLLPGVVVVVAGPPGVERRFAEVPATLRCLELVPFGPDETATVVRRRGLPESMAHGIHALSGGLPALVDLLTHPWSQEPEPGERSLVDHLLASLPDPGLATAVLTGAVPRWFDRGALAAARGGLDADGTGWWRVAPVVEAPTAAVAGRHLHPVVREAVLAHLAERQPRLLAGAHGRLAGHHARRAAAKAVGWPTIDRHRTERAYHLVAGAGADPGAVAVAAAAGAWEAGHDVAAVADAARQALDERGDHATDVGELLDAAAQADAGRLAAAARARSGEPFAPAVRRQLALARWAGEPGWPRGEAPAGVEVAIAWWEGRHADVVALADAALDADPSDAWLWAVRGDARLRLGEPGAAADLRAAAAAGELAWVPGRLGVVALAGGDLTEAVEHFGEAMRLDARDAISLGLRGEAYLRLGRLGPARHDLTSAVWAEPSCPWLRVSLADVAGRAGDDHRALEHLLDAVQLAPDSPHVHALLARVQLRLGDAPAAYAAATAALELGDAFDDPALGADRLVFGTGGLEHAGLYEWLVVPPVGRVDALVVLAAAAADLDRPDEAEDHLDDALALVPRRADALVARARLRRLRRDLAGARADFEAAHASGFDDERAACEEGELCLELGDAGAAVRALDRAVALATDGVPYALRGAARRATGDVAGTIADHTEAIERGVADHWVFAQRGEARCASGDPGGLDDVERAYALAPDVVWVRLLRERLHAAALDAPR